MQTYLAVTPAQLQEASKYSRSFAHVAYRLGEDSTLLRQNLLLQTRGGLLSISDREAPLIRNPEALCAAVLRECNRRNFIGVVLDFEEPPTQDRITFAAKLGPVLTSNRRLLYVTEPYGHTSPHAVCLLCTAISGGIFRDHLQEAATAAGGAGNLALDVQRLRMDFPLPCRSGEGVPLTEETLRSLIARETPAIFFSQELCSRYFTYTRKGQTHFILFDDADTLMQKIRIGNSLGFSAAFFMWPEVQDIAGKLFNR